MWWLFLVLLYILMCMREEKVSHRRGDDVFIPFEDQCNGMDKQQDNEF